MGKMKNIEYIQKQSEIAVLLVNFGGPRNLDEVKPFLYNLFSDPAILNFPFGFLYRKPLAWLISSIRKFISAPMYKLIGGASPLIPITYEQKDKLQTMFATNKLKIDVFCAFRYSEPFIPCVMDEIVSKGYTKIIVLPLFPQYSYTTCGSIQLEVEKWRKRYKGQNSELSILFISNWYEDDDYIQSFAGLIQESLKDLDLRSAEIIFSAHSIPLSNIDKGDPYQSHITRTAQAIIQKLNWKKKWHIAYQSKIGPVRWLEPGTDSVIKEIASRNKNANILVVPISFVSEHVETIYEIGILYKEAAKKHGIKRFVRVPALNTDKYLIQALYNQVVSCLDNNQVTVKELILTK